MKNKFVFFIFFLSFSIVSYTENSYLKLDKLKNIIKKGEKKKNQAKIPEKPMQHKIFIKNQSAVSGSENLQNKEKETTPFIKPELLGMIRNLNYRAVLLKYNEQYLYLKEGETDKPSKIKIIKIAENKVILTINNKKIELEVNDE